MGESRGLPALAMVALLVVATVTADEPSGPLDVALSAEGQTPEPAGPAKLEASGESDLSTSAQHLGKGVTSVAFPGSPLATEPRDPSPGGDSDPESGSVSAHPLRGGNQGPIPEVPSQSSESEEGGERDPDSEEALASQGI